MCMGFMKEAPNAFDCRSKEMDHGADTVKKCRVK